jgi:hypothetical protein
MMDLLCHLLLKSRRSLANNLKKLTWHIYPALVQKVGVNDKYLNWLVHNKHTIEPFGASTSLVALFETQSVCRKSSCGLFFLLLIFFSFVNRTKVVKNVKRYRWGKCCITKLLGDVRKNWFLEDKLCENVDYAGFNYYCANCMVLQLYLTCGEKNSETICSSSLKILNFSFINEHMKFHTIF